jgi:hypothetical protein
MTSLGLAGLRPGPGLRRETGIGWKDHGLAEVYPTVTYREVRAALAWLESAFGLESRIFGEDDTADIDHAALVHGDGMVLVESERPEELHGSHAGHGWV